MIQCHPFDVFDPFSQALVIAGVIPIDLLAKERRAVHLRKDEVCKEVAKLQERLRILETWQTAWDEETTPRWTATLIKHETVE